MSKLNVADQALLVDILIDSASRTESLFAKKEYLSLINKVKGLELEEVKFTNDDFQKVLDEVEVIERKPKYCEDYKTVEDFVEGYGYTIKNKIENGIIWYKSFVKGEHRNVWATYQGFQTADLIDGMYCNHKKFDDLSDALARPL